MLTGKICWTNSRSASDLQWMLCFWRGYMYQIMRSEQRNSDIDHWCFLWCCPAQALEQTVWMHPMTFWHRGSFVRGIKPIPARVWILFSLTGKIFWTNSRVASDFQWKLCFWRGYQIMTSDQRKGDIDHWCFLWCWPAQALKQSV